MAGGKRTGILRILAVLGGVLLLAGMLGRRVGAGGAQLLPRLEAAWRVLEEAPDFTHTSVSEGEVLLHDAQGVAAALPLSGALDVFGDGVIFAWQDAGDVFFVTGVVGGRAEGYVFSRDLQVNMRGLSHLQEEAAVGEQGRVWRFSGMK